MTWEMLHELCRRHGYRLRLGILPHLLENQAGTFKISRLAAASVYDRDFCIAAVDVMVYRNDLDGVARYLAPFVNEHARSTGGQA